MSRKKLPISIMSIVSSADYIPETLKSMSATHRSIFPQYGSYIICPRNGFDTSLLDVTQINVDIEENYSLWILKNLHKYVHSEYVLIQQWDSCVIDPSKWTDDFLSYDYVGAPWSNDPAHPIGNGGFSLRSRAFLTACSSPDIIDNLPVGQFVLGNEDWHACGTHRMTMTKKYGISFAPYNLALQFSVERFGPSGFNLEDLDTYKSFGFHGDFNTAGMNFINKLES